MILVDTSVWIDHLRRGDEHLSQLLDTGNVLVHAHVIGELALGNLKDRGMILSMLQDMPQAPHSTGCGVSRHTLTTCAACTADSQCT